MLFHMSADSQWSVAPSARCPPRIGDTAEMDARYRSFTGLFPADRTSILTSQCMNDDIAPG